VTSEAIQIICDTLGGEAGKFHQMPQGGGRVLAKVAPVHWPALLRKKG